jgi:serine/threonine protein kinase
MESWDFDEGVELAPGRHALSLLGGGRRFEAWLAWDERLRTMVVAKLLRPDQAGDPVAFGALAAEVALLRRLSHPMLVRSFDFELDGERPHVVLEYIDGPRLSTLIRRDGLILEQVLPLALNLCSALHYLECERVVHMDVKPRNIIMAGAPRLIDLSVARPLEAIAELRSPVGTDAYMAPEQCDPERFGEIGPPADVWGLGVTIHQAVTGRRPYPRRVDDGPYPQVAWEPPVGPLPGLPSKLEPLVRACLDPRPADRPSAAQLADALEPLAAALPAPRIGRFRPGGKRMLDELQGGVRETSPQAHIRLTGRA